MKYHPITDTINLLQSQRTLLKTLEFEHVYPSLSEFLKQMSEKGFDAKRDLSHLLDFLVTTLSSSKGTQTRFRNEAERFVLFCWNEREKSFLKTNAEDIKLYVDWIWDPPKQLVSNTTIASRFKSKKKSDVRIVNEAWRPFVLRRPKANRKVESLINPEAKLKSKHAYRLNQSSLQNSYASLNVFFNALLDNELVTRNSIPKAKKTCKYLIKGKNYQPPHTIEDETWELFISCLTKAADEDSKFEIHRFIVLTLKVLFLRISELSHRDYFRLFLNKTPNSRIANENHLQ